MAKKLEHFPNEVLLEIAKQTDLRSLKDLASMNSHFNALFAPLLYRSSIEKEDDEVLFLAARKGSIRVLEHLKAAGKDVAVLRVAIKKSDGVLEWYRFPGDKRKHSLVQKHSVLQKPNLENLEILKTFHLTGGPKTYKTHRAESALHVAAQHGQDAVVEWLLAEGADINAPAVGSIHICSKNPAHDAPGNDPPCYARSALHLAICNRRWDITRRLLSRGAREDTSPSFGVRPIHTAVVGTAPIDVIERLLRDYDEDVDARDSHGRTPLYCALNNWLKRRDIVVLLLSYGARFILTWPLIRDQIRRQDPPRLLDAATLHMFKKYIRERQRRGQGQQAEVKWGAVRVMLFTYGLLEQGQL